MTEQQPELVELPNLTAALVAFQAELPAIVADETAKVPTKTGGEYSYKYADLASVSRKVIPKLAEHGLVFTCWPTVNGQQFVMRYRLMHVSGERIEGDYPISGGNAQAVGSAITYARRYCLLAVTGVSPDDEDDDGRSGSAVAPPDPELEEARAKVRGAWQFQYGDLVTSELAQAYRAWSRGGDLWQAAPGDLRKYAAYLSNLPKEDAGSDPADDASNQQPVPMTGRQRGKLFALFGDIGLHDKGDQLTWVNKQLGTSYESRADITAAHAGQLIDAIQRGIDAPDEGGQS